MKALALALFVGIIGLTGTALADSPHYQGVSGAVDSDGDLVVKFKIAGLGNAITTAVTVSSTNAFAEYACATHSGKFPSDPKKQDVAGPVSASGVFTSGRNGQITGTLLLTPPASTLDCPGGQHAVLVSVDYDAVSVTSDVTGTIDLGTFSRIFFTL